jgi:hypothetical protein
MSRALLLGALEDSGGSSDTGGMVQPQVVGAGVAGDTRSGARLVLVVEPQGAARDDRQRHQDGVEGLAAV